MLRKKGALAVPIVPLLLILFSPCAVALREGGSSSALPFETVVPGSYYEWEPVDTAAATGNVVSFTVVSNVSISTAFMTSSQFSSFNSSNTEISNSLFIQNGTSTQHSLQVPRGDYFLVFFAPAGNANVSYNFQEYPNSPFISGPLSAPEPTGIASFGLYNDSGAVAPYSVETNEVVGVATIASLEAFNATAEKANSTITGATLQLNCVLVVNEQAGGQQVYWAQNTPDFVTAASQLAFGDNLWNLSVSGFLSNQTVTSNEGHVSNYTQAGMEQYYYSYEASNSTYATPLELALFINETSSPGEGVLVQMGAQVFENASETTASLPPADWFDNITIHDPSVQSAYFYVSGNNTTPTGTFYDTELIFGGENNGEATNFRDMGASLGLFYDNASSGLLMSFPSYYGFGQDTAEAADNLQVSLAVNGIAHVSVGNPSYVYLGRGSGTFSLAQAVSMASSEAPTASTSTSSPSQQRSTSSPTSSGLSSSFTPSYLEVVVGSVVVILLGAAFWLRPCAGRRPSPTPDTSHSRRAGGK